MRNAFAISSAPKPTQYVQDESHLRHLRQPRVTAREHHPQLLVADRGRSEGLVDDGFRLWHMLYVAFRIGHFDHPIVTVATVREWLGVTQAGANNLVNRLTKVGLLREITGYSRNRRFRFDPYLRLFEEPEEANV